MNKHKLTKEGLIKLKDELDYLSTTKREELKVMLEDMRKAGDLRENDGYSMAKEDSQSNEIRIAEIEGILRNYELIDEDNTSNGRVSVGNTITVDVDGKTMELSIVGDSEANPLENKISQNSPISLALIGKKAGDTAKVSLPKGEVEYKIIKIA